MSTKTLVAFVEARGGDDFFVRAEDLVGFFNRDLRFKAQKNHCLIDAAWSLSAQEGTKWIVVLSGPPLKETIEQYPDQVKAGIRVLVVVNAQKNGTGAAALIDEVKLDGTTVNVMGNNGMIEADLMYLLERATA